MVIYGLNFSFLVHFSKVSRRKKRRFFLCGAILSRDVHDCLSKCPNSKKSPLALKNSWLRGCSTFGINFCHYWTFFGSALSHSVIYLGAIHKGCPHIRRGQGGQEKVDKGGKGEGVASQMWTSTRKTNYSYHICEIYSDNLAVCLCIKFSFCLHPIMPVCHIYFVVNPIFWNDIIEIV